MESRILPVNLSFVLFMSCVFMLSRLFIAVLWLHAGKGLTSWLFFVMFNYVFVTFPCGILGQVWYLIVSIPDLCRLSYFEVTRSIHDSINIPKIEFIS